MEQKLCRKLNKYKSILKKDFGISGATLSQHLMVCNAGLSTNSTTEEFFNVFSPYGVVKDITFPVNKSYSFVSFASEESAVSCYGALNGSAFLSSISGSVFLMYVAEVPITESLSKFGEPPEGIYVLEEFVTPEEETLLLDCVSFDGSHQTELKHRLVKHYGYEFKYGSNNVDKDSPLDEKIPEECQTIMNRFKGLSPNQMTVNRYQPGQGIPLHIDTHSAFEDPILSLSLGSWTVMDFKNGESQVSLVLPRRSLLVMSGEGRYAWKHGISPRKCDTVPIGNGFEVRARGTRTSLTLRRVREAPCNCQFPQHCDSQMTKISENMAANFERDYVRRVYDSISDHFSETRHKPWPRILQLVESLSPGSVLVDIGCGNCKYFGHNGQIQEIGIDQCFKLAEISKERGFQVLQGSCMSVPLRDGVADAIICIAVIHHLSTESRRLHAIKEMVRVLRPGGRALIYTWAKNQVRNDEMSSYLKQSRKNRRLLSHGVTTDNISNPDSMPELDSPPSNSPTCVQKEIVLTSEPCPSQENLPINLPVHTNRTDFEQQDVLVPWKIKNNQNKESSQVPTFLRFYHVFVENELEALCNKLEDVIILDNYYDQGNWCVLFEKTQ